MTLPTEPQAYLRKALFPALGFVLLVKAVLFAADHSPNFFMGDSAVFIATALTEWFPPQRSWTYGFFIRWTCLPAHGLWPLLVAQSLAGAVTCAALGLLLMRWFRVSRGIATAMMILCAMEPLQVLYERMVLPETFSLTAMAVLLVGAFAYCERPRIGVLIGIQVIFVALISLRLQFLAPAGAIVLTLPFLAALRPASPEPRETRNRWRTAWLHLVIGLLVALPLHHAYRLAMSIKHRQPPAYSYGTEVMVAGAFASHLRPEDAPNATAAAVMRDDVEFPLKDRSLRVYQTWGKRGLTDRLNVAFGDEYTVARVSGQILVNSVRRDPAGAFICGLRNYGDYWNLSSLPALLRDEREVPIITPSYQPTLADDLRRYFHVDPGSYPRRTLSTWLHAGSVPWLLILLASPALIIAGALAVRSKGWSVWLPPWIATALLLQNSMLSPMPQYRYLQPLTFPTLLAIGILLDRWRNRGRPTERVAHRNP